MQATPSFGDYLAERFGLDSAPTLVSRTIHKTEIPVVLFETSNAAEVVSKPIDPQDGYLIHFNLKPCPDHELWIGGKATGRHSFGSGEFVIHNLNNPPAVRLHTAIGSMMYFLSRKLLNQICDEEGAPRIADLPWTPGLSLPDQVVRRLSETLRPAMIRPDAASPLFVDHVTQALVSHVIATYGGLKLPGRAINGGLAPWQEQRAKELLISNLDGRITLSDLARECGLSTSHFSRAFCKSVGAPPHRWLLAQRVERAKELLRSSTLELAAIAVECGFSDQSHLSRVFRNSIGAGPAAWRRLHNLRRVHHDPYSSLADTSELI